MIVRDEAAAILRCLESVRPLVDYALIQDTGSTDHTPEIARDWLHESDLPGDIHHEPWRDFAHNRSVALARLRERENIDYALVIDADDVLGINREPAALKASLVADCYEIELRYGRVTYRRPQLFSNRVPYRYRGVLHEFAEGPGQSAGFTSGLHIVVEDGPPDPEKYARHAAVLEQALATETDAFLRARYTFYLARSYRDAGRPDLALPLFWKRAALGFWPDEVFHALYSAALIEAAQGRPFVETVSTYMRACEAAPHRAEAWHGAAALARKHGRHDEAFELARHGLSVKRPASGLFLEPWIYDYGLYREMLLAAQATGRTGFAKAAMAKMLIASRA